MKVLNIQKHFAFYSEEDNCIMIGLTMSLLLYLEIKHA